MLTRFSFDLVWWPSFWPKVTQFQTWPRNHQDKHFEQDSWWLLQNCNPRVFTKFSFDLAWWPSFSPKWPSFKLDLEIIKTKILSNIHDDYFKNITSGVLRLYFELARCPSFWPKVTRFQTNLEIIKTNILSKIHDDCFKNVTFRMLTIFSFDLAWWPTFWPQVTQFQTWPRFHRGKHSEQVSSRLGENWPLEC